MKVEAIAGMEFYKGIESVNHLAETVSRSSQVNTQPVCDSETLPSEALESRSECPVSRRMSVMHEKRRRNVISSDSPILFELGDLKLVRKNAHKVDEESNLLGKTFYPLESTPVPFEQNFNPLDKSINLFDEPSTPVNKPLTQEDKSSTPLDEPSTPMDKGSTPVDKPLAPVDKPLTPIHKPSTPEDTPSPSMDETSRSENKNSHPKQLLVDETISVHPRGRTSGASEIDPILPSFPRPSPLPLPSSSPLASTLARTAPTPCEVYWLRCLLRWSQFLETLVTVLLRRSGGGASTSPSCRPHRGFTASLFLCTVLALLSAVRGEGECHSQIMCYECTSWNNPLCSDPFNFTLPRAKQPPTEECDGCCVKLVQHIGTPYASVRRTCTDKMQIKLFVVDHVCMREGNGRGHMCFCEEDLCNAAPPVPLSFLFSPSHGKLPTHVPLLSTVQALFHASQTWLLNVHRFSLVRSFKTCCSCISVFFSWLGSAVLKCMIATLTPLAAAVTACAPSVLNCLPFSTAGIVTAASSFLQFFGMSTNLLSHGANQFANSVHVVSDVFSTVFLHSLEFLVTWPLTAIAVVVFHRLLSWSQGLR